MDNLKEFTEMQLESQGVSVVTVSDGTVFTFTKELLTKLLAKSLDTGKVVVFIKKEMQQ